MAILAAFALPLLLEKEKKDTVCILILSLIPLILFSFVSTKLNWYILCIFPPLILLAAFGANEIVKNSKKNIIGLSIISIPVLMMFLCIGNNLRTVTNLKPERDIIKATFSLISRTEDFSGKKIYKNIAEEDGSWAQSEFLSLELAGDLFPTEGGINAWNSDKTAYLFTQTELLTQIEVGYKIISEDDMFCIVMHSQ